MSDYRWSLFWRKVDRRGGKDACWPWTASRNDKGYGNFWDGSSVVKATRFLMGITDPDIQVLHKCDNPPCCNPNHLFVGSNSDNVRDCVLKSRYFNNRSAVQVDVPLVRKIRDLATQGRRHADIAVLTGLSQPTVSNIVSRRTWSSVS